MYIDKLTSTFSDIYNRDIWTNGSGPGSFPTLNSCYLKFLDDFIRNNEISSLSDIGCGDFQLMSAVNLAGVAYTGYDVVPTVIDTNRAANTQPNVSFQLMPADPFALPSGDLAHIKDVLIHLDNDSSMRLLNALATKFKYVLATNNFCLNKNQFNKEIEPGQFRPLDVSLPPFNYQSVTLLRYSRERALDPRHPRLVSALLRKYVWPGRKHVQLIIGRADKAHFKT